MFELIKLAIIGIAIAAVVGALAVAWHNFTGKYVTQGKTEQLALDTPVYNEMKADRDQWKTAEAARESENADMQRKLGLQNEAIASLNKRTDAAIARTNAIAAAQQARKVHFDADQARDQQIIITAQPVRPPEEELKLTDDIIRGALGFRTGKEALQ